MQDVLQQRVDAMNRESQAGPSQLDADIVSNVLGQTIKPVLTVICALGYG